MPHPHTLPAVLRTYAAKLMAVVVFSLIHALAPAAWAKEPIGEVIFVSQDAWKLEADHARVSLKTGDKIHIGDTLETAPDAQLHLKMIDDAFIALRPGSRLHIRDYRAPTPADPQAGIRLDVLHGTIRSITGHIGEGYKNHFRLNTPIAAIGIRGTDFSLQAKQDYVQAGVHSGAIVMAPFGEGCARDALGPCHGDNALLATASAQSYIELRAGAPRPTLIQGTPDNLLPSPEEERSRSRALPADAQHALAPGGASFTLVAALPQHAPDPEEEAAAKQAESKRDDLLASQTSAPTQNAPAGHADTDRDGLDDAAEHLAGANALMADTDGDGLTDGQDPRPAHSDTYPTMQGNARLTPQQLAAFQLDRINIRRTTWGANPALIQEITLVRKDDTVSAPDTLLVERRQDQAGNVYWGRAASFGLLEEALRANPEQAALSPELREALLKAGVTQENASLSALQWLKYHRAAPTSATVVNSTQYLVASQGLERAQTPPINKDFSAFNLPYTLNLQDAYRITPDAGSDSLPVIDFQFKMNYPSQTFIATLTLLDPRPGHPNGRTEMEFRGTVNQSGMIFGGNDQGYLKGFFINEMRQIAFIFERHDARGILGGTIIADQDAQHTDMQKIQPRMALYQTQADAPVLWGRWENFAQIHDIAELAPLLNADRELIAYNNTFALLRPNPGEDLNLPTQGTFTFEMAAHEAVIRHGQGLELAQVQNPMLKIHFDRRQFDTHLNLAAPSLTQPVAITASGPLAANGVFTSDPALSNSTVAGFVDQGAQNAGMLFERKLDDGAQATGVVHWQRH